MTVSPQFGHFSGYTMMIPFSLVSGSNPFPQNGHFIQLPSHDVHHIFHMGDNVLLLILHHRPSSLRSWDKTTLADFRPPTPAIVLVHMSNNIQSNKYDVDMHLYVSIAHAVTDISHTAYQAHILSAYLHQSISSYFPLLRPLWGGVSYKGL